MPQQPTVLSVPHAVIRSAVAALLLLAGCVGERPGETVPAPAADRQDGPRLDLPLEGLGGDRFRMADFDGDLRLVNFWATWCGPCVREMPALESLQREWDDRPFQIAGISVDTLDKEAVRQFADRLGVTYPLALDDGSAAETFGGVFVLPTTFVVDGQGHVVHRIIGEFHPEEWRDVLLALMKSG